MIAGGAILLGLDALVREATLFAATGFAIGGLDDLAVDLVYLRTLIGRREGAALSPPRRQRHFAIVVAAWDESAVIGAMLRTALDRLDYPSFAIHVGTYPNDRATIDAVADVAAADPRVRLVIGDTPGPTTKADCLNAIWAAMRRAEAHGARRADAIILHDAEDVVHAQELNLFDAMLDRHMVVQLPVRPLIAPHSKWVSGHYADEFAQAHLGTLVVRQALGAGLPLAGVGCAIARDALDRIAAVRDDAPFDPGSLTEDYELGLMLAAMGGSAAIAHARDPATGEPIAVRAYFPDTIEAAVRQKARWMVGIALAGWDRVGWSRAADWREHWMRMRDRRGPIAVIVLAVAYLALIGWAITAALHYLAGTSATVTGTVLHQVLVINAWLLGWRLIWRMIFTGRWYGPIEALRAAPRLFIGNVVALLAARRAVFRYIAMLRGEALRWDKTAHVFPIGEGEA